MLYKFAFLVLAVIVVTNADALGQPQSASGKTTAETNKPPVTKPRLQPNPVYAEILPTLREKTSVPLRLPAYLPYDEPKSKGVLKANQERDAEAEDLSATIEQVNETSYGIQLAVGKDCKGAHVCRWGGVSGSTVFHDDYPERRKIPVRLHGGIRGSFVDSECGAYCDESVLYWSENGYHYSISSKAASKEELIRLANSAIDVADAQAPAATKPKKQGKVLQ